MPLTEDISAHETQILRSSSKCYRSVCPSCHAEPPFTRHDIRRRSFRCLDGNSVIEIRSWVVRWRCHNCRRTFTDCPPFALPHKRFVKSTIFAVGGRFVGEPCSSYRECGTANRAPIEYDSRPEDPPMFSHSTLWRWLSWLGEMPRTVFAATQLLYAKQPNLTLHREAWMIAPEKYRSESRRCRLQDAFRTLGVSKLFDSIFPTCLFPNFATAHGFR